MLYGLQRIKRICKDLKKLEYSQTSDVTDYKMIEGHYLSPEDVKNKINWKSFSTNDTWGKNDYNCWFKTEFEMPKEMAGKTVAFHVKTIDEGWDAVNPQFILFVDGKQIQGLDVNHREVIITQDAKAYDKFEIDLHAYAGMNDSNKEDFKFDLKTKLVVIEEDVRGLYYDLQVPFLVCEKLDAEDIRRIEMIELLNQSINLLDFRRKHSDEFFESVKEAREYLQINFYEKFCGEQPVVASVVGHTHIDVAWLWTVAQTRQKVGRSFATAINLLDQYPEFKFMSSQPQLYQFVKEDYPALYEKIKDAVTEGRWEAEGAMWLEADCNLTSGESLVRQILYGTKFFKEEFGVENKVLWLPDVFGYSAALPQILKKCNIPYFMTTKISWSQTNKIPFDTFMWKGIDGSEVLTHFITTTEPYPKPSSRFQTTYNGQLHPGALIGAWDRYQQKSINKDVLVAFGFGDGGGGVTPEMLEIGRRLEKGIPGCPQVKYSNSLDYFKGLEQNIADKRVPKWSGELYLEFHRGTYTSMARNKRDNRKSELLYAEAEKWMSVASLFGMNYEKGQLDDNWKVILLNQFHDILPGTSIREVYDVTEIQYAKVLENGKHLVNQSLKELCSRIDGDKGDIVVFNSLSFNRSDIVEIQLCDLDHKKNWVAVDSEGNVSALQKVSDNKYIFFVKGIPSIGYKVYKIQENMDIIEEDMFNVSENTLENKFFKIELDNSGHITSYFDKLASREVVISGEAANVFQTFEDKPMEFDNWDIDIYYKEKMWIVDDVKKIEVVENGPVRATLHIEKKFLDSTISQFIHIYKDISKVDFETEIDWKESQVLLKVAFPVDINADKASYEIQFGNVERPNHSNTTWDQARFEVCAQKWVDLSDGGYGVSLLNDSKYGFDILEKNMRMTLIKSGIYPNPKTDQEIHRFTYSFYAHQGTWKEADTEILTANLNTKLNPMIKMDDSRSELGQSMSFINVDVDNIHIEAVKVAEDNEGYIVRMYESHNKKTSCNINAFSKINSVKECNLLEDEIMSLVHDDFKVKLDFEPFEIKTIRMQF